MKNKSDVVVEVHQGSDTAYNISFWRVLLLCIPALILGAALRASFLAVTPEVYYQTDTYSYFITASKLLTEGDFHINPKRSFLYPILLVFAPLLPGSVAVGVAVIQHILGLAIIVGIGWIVAQMTRLPVLWVPLATVVAAVWPRMLWQEHVMTAEVWLLAAFVAAVAIALPCGALRDKSRLFWFLVMLVVMVSLKPQGRPLWLGLMITAIAMAGNPLKWEWRSLGAVMIAVVIMLTSPSGSDRQGGWLLLTSSFPFVKTEGEPYSEYRALLRPFVEDARGDLENYASRQGYYKKALGGQQTAKFVISDKWIELTKKKNLSLYVKVVRRLALEGIFAHPYEYSKLVLRKIALAASEKGPGDTISPGKFWRSQERETAKRLDQVELLYGTDRDSHLRMVEERRQRTIWMAPLMHKLSRALTWTLYSERGIGKSPNIGLTALGWLLALGVFVCLSPRHFVCRALLLLPAVLYLLGTFGVGDALGRYVHPVEWVGIVLVFIGLDAMTNLIARGSAWLRPSTWQ